MKLHIGCGERYIPGWVHVDIEKHEHVDIVASANDLPLRDECVDVIYASHVLEHFGRHQSTDVLCEWYRVLKPHGLLRICVPDFREAVKNYIKHRDVGIILGQLVGGQKSPHDLHMNVFDEISLSQDLACVGFREISRYDWRHTEHAWLDDFSQSYWPHMDKEGGQLLSLNMEAVK